MGVTVAGKEVLWSYGVVKTWERPSSSKKCNEGKIKYRPNEAFKDRIFTAYIACDGQD